VCIIPEVGRTPIKNNPTAQRVYFSGPPEKNTLPVKKAIMGMRRKLMIWVVICNL
jgi:hypothetical protein